MMLSIFGALAFAMMLLIGRGILEARARLRLHRLKYRTSGKEVILKVYAKASKPGRHKFRAVVKSDDPETSLVQEEMTWFHAAETAEDGPVILTADGAGQ